MAFIRSWNKHELYTSLFGSVSTAAADVTTRPTLFFYVICTHTGGQAAIGSGAVVEIWDGGTATGTKMIHLESASGDRAPFGVSLMKPLLCSGGLTLAATATGLNTSIGYYDYIA